MSFFTLHCKIHYVSQVFWKLLTCAFAKYVCEKVLKPWTAGRDREQAPSSPCDLHISCIQPQIQYDILYLNGKNNTSSAERSRNCRKPAHHLSCLVLRISNIKRRECTNRLRPIASVGQQPFGGRSEEQEKTEENQPRLRIKPTNQEKITTDRTRFPANHPRHPRKRSYHQTTGLVNDTRRPTHRAYIGRCGWVALQRS